MNKDKLIVKKGRFFFSQSTLSYNHYDNFVQMYLVLENVSQVSDVAHGSLVVILFERPSQYNLLLRQERVLKTYFNQYPHGNL